MNWANFTTFSRVAMIPLIVALYHSGMEWAHLLAAILFSIASLTDWLDGYLARKLKLTSPFGAFIDPVADKLLVVTILIMLVTVHPVIFIAAMIIIGREILVSALREWMAGRGERKAVAVAFSGKLKTTVQMLAIIALLMASSALPELILQTGYGLIYLAALLSIISMIQYFASAWPVLFPKT